MITSGPDLPSGGTVQQRTEAGAEPSTATATDASSSRSDEEAHPQGVIATATTRAGGDRLRGVDFDEEAHHDGVIGRSPDVDCDGDGP